MFSRAKRGRIENRKEGFGLGFDRNQGPHRSGGVATVAGTRALISAASCLRRPQASAMKASAQAFSRSRWSRRSGSSVLRIQWQGSSHVFPWAATAKGIFFGVGGDLREGDKRALVLLHEEEEQVEEEQRRTRGESVRRVEETRVLVLSMAMVPQKKKKKKKNKREKRQGPRAGAGAGAGKGTRRVLEFQEVTRKKSPTSEKGMNGQGRTLYKRRGGRAVRNLKGSVGYVCHAHPSTMGAVWLSRHMADIICGHLQGWLARPTLQNLIVNKFCYSYNYYLC